MLDKHAKKLFDRYMTGETSLKEEIKLLARFAFGLDDEERGRLVDRWFDLVPAEHSLSPERADAIFRRITRKERQACFRRAALATAAGVALLLSVGALFFLPRGGGSEGPVVLVAAGDILPGSKRAILTLSDGSLLPLDTTSRGQVAREGEIAVVHHDKALSYEGATADAAVRYHLLSTPRGGYYEMTLPDGSRAWLNAASSIRYPLAFAGDERRVEVAGEVYFEVAKGDRGQSFIVSADGRAEVEVLGTRFNVNSYGDEGEIAVTLLEGSVNFLVAASGISVPLHPGEQARLDDGGSVRVATVDTRETMAWKDGKFVFDRADIRSIMRQLVRWYDVEVEYRGEVSSLFGGTISRDVNISRVLRVLERTGKVSFEVEGNTVIVISHEL